MDPRYTGQKIADRRKEKAMTQKDIAETLHVSIAAVSKWERGLNYPDLSLMEPLAELLGISVPELLGLEDQPAEQVIRSVTALSAGEQRAQRRRTVSYCIGFALFLPVLILCAAALVGSDEALYILTLSGNRGMLNLLALALGFAAWGFALAGLIRKERGKICSGLSWAFCAFALYFPILITDLTMRFEHYGTVEDTIGGYHFGAMVLLLVNLILNGAGYLLRRRG